MKTIGWLLLLGVVAGGCQQRAQEAAPGPTTPPATSAASALAIGEVQLTSYIGYERARLALVHRLLDQLQQKRAAASAPVDAAATAELLAAPAAYRAQLEQGSAALREQAGLSALQVEQLDALVDAVIVARLAWQQAGGDEQLASIERRFRDQVATLPAAERAPVEAEFRQLIGEVTALRDAAEARRSFGNGAVDLVLAHAAELTALRELQFKLGEQM